MSNFTQVEQNPTRAYLITNLFLIVIVGASINKEQWITVYFLKYFLFKNILK